MSLARTITIQESPTLPLVITDDLINEIASTPALLELINNKKIRIANIANMLGRINLQLISDNLKDTKKVSLEKLKLAVMDAVNKYLKDLNYNHHQQPAVEEKQSSRLWYWVKAGFMSLVGLIGLTESSVMTFLGARVLLMSLFPAIPLPALLTVAILFTVISAIQFIGFEIGILRTMFGVNTNGSLKKIIDTHEQQIVTTAGINKSLTDVNILCHLTKPDFMQFKKIAVKCNEDVELKKVTYHEYKEHPVKKGFRLAFTGFGAIMSVVGSYFGATMFLTTMAPAMLGTPIGWIVIGGLVVSSVVFYFAMQAKGMRDMFNPLMKQFDNVKDDVQAFHTVTDAEFNHALLNENIFKPSEADSQKNNARKNIHALDLAVPQRKPAHDDKLFSRRLSQPALDRIRSPSLTRL